MLLKDYYKMIITVVATCFIIIVVGVGAGDVIAIGIVIGHWNLMKFTNSHTKKTGYNLKLNFNFDFGFRFSHV